MKLYTLCQCFVIFFVVVLQSFSINLKWKKKRNKTETYRRWMVAWIVCVCTGSHWNYYGSANSFVVVVAAVFHCILYHFKWHSNINVNTNTPNTHTGNTVLFPLKCLNSFWCLLFSDDISIHLYCLFASFSTFG